MESTAILKSSSPPELRLNKSCFNTMNPSSTTQFKGLNIQNITSMSQNGRISSPTISDLQNTSAPTSQQSTSFPFVLESDSTNDMNWPYPTSGEELTLDSPHSFPGNPSHLNNSNSLRSNIYPATMSDTLGIQPYDSNFDNFNTWPQFEFQDQLFSPIPNSGGILYEEPEILTSSTYSRSPSSSPPRSRLSAEQRELKRQQDQARRETKSCLRRARSVSSNSNHYSISQQRTSPDLLPRSDYVNSVTPSPLLSQCSIQNSPALSSAPFLSSYSPQMNAQVPSDIYGRPFSVGSPSDYTSAMSSYPIPSYSTQTETTSMPSFLERPHSLPLSSVPDHLGLYCPPVPPTGTRLGPSESTEPVRVVHSRPKPQCWEHGCNGRQFSTFSNLLRHQREKSGAAQKSSCPHCGAEFTRTTARNGHLAHDKCKQRRSS